MTSPSSPEESGLIETWQQALERLVIYTAMEDGQLALNCERIIASALEEARLALEDALRMVKQYAPNGIERSQRFGKCVTALEQSGEGLGSSVASRAGEGLRPFASDNQQILGKED